MKKLLGPRGVFALLLVFLVVSLPMFALATGEDLGNYIGPDVGVAWTLLVVSVAIALDTLLGIMVGVKNKEFDLRILPQFLISGVLPYTGSLALLALLTKFVGTPFDGMFYAAVAAVMGKYLADLWDKLKLLFGPGIVTGG